jgi:hypothetical protein
VIKEDHIQGWGNLLVAQKLCDDVQNHIALLRHNLLQQEDMV